jgi:peptidoglycan DL-endopeptidase LytF
MSRRDTIIIAVLVNAALLMILFATAMRSDQAKGETKKGSKMGGVKLEELAVAPSAESPADELLNEFVTSMPTLAESRPLQDNALFFEEAELAFASPPSHVVEGPVMPSSLSEEVKTAKPRVDEQFVNVTVKKGDFLEKIAKANNTTIAAIVKANNMSSTQLKVGQVLKIPLHDGKKVQQKPPSLPLSNSQEEYYVVKEGDNPWLIASRNKINLEELLRLNGLDEQKAKRLRPGDKLKIR